MSRLEPIVVIPLVVSCLFYAVDDSIALLLFYAVLIALWYTSYHANSPPIHQQQQHPSQLSKSAVSNPFQSEAMELINPVHPFPTDTSSLVSPLEESLWLASISHLSKEDLDWFDLDLKVRFLRGSAYITNYAKREAYLKKKLGVSISFRKEHRLKTILDSTLPFIKDFQMDCWPMKILPRGDSLGHPIVVIRVGDFNYSKIKHGQYFPDVIHYFAYHQEMLLKRVRSEYEKNTGTNPVVQPMYSLLVDMNWLGFRELREMYNLSFFGQVVGMWGNSYPDSLYRIYLVNSPILLVGILRLVYPFMEPDTVEKLRVVTKSNEAFLQDGIPIEHLPAFIGGSAEMLWVY